MCRGDQYKEAYSLFPKKKFTDKYYPSGYLWALWADIVSPPMNSIASRDQFKPKRVGKNLVVNYTVESANSYKFNLFITDTPGTRCR